MPDAQDVKEQLLRTDAEYRELYQLHHELDEQIRSMSTNPHPSEHEQLEEAQLKKRKLQLKDRMEDIVRRYSSPPPPGPTSTFAHA
ncbi:MAG: YdcH family protein [Acidobacteria bacterium]|nr:YdcH family protein [Acidobacteriota bacterium]